MTTDCTLTITPVTWDDPDAVRLREAQRTELDARYGTDDHEPGAVPTAETVAVFLLARDTVGTAVGCGGLRLLEPGTAEIKRMYVEPARRGHGHSRAVLRALVQHARDVGLREVRLETGSRQVAAVRLYESEGFTPIPVYGYWKDHPETLCFALVL